MTLLNVYDRWKQNRYSARWASEHFLHIKALRKVREVRAQLADIATSRRLTMHSCGNDWDAVRQALCAGLFHNSAKAKGAAGLYANLRTGIEVRMSMRSLAHSIADSARTHTQCNLHPTSSLSLGAAGSDHYVVYQELVLTTKEYMRNVTIVDPYWLADLGKAFFSVKRLEFDSEGRRIEYTEAEEKAARERRAALARKSTVSTSAVPPRREVIGAAKPPRLTAEAADAMRESAASSAAVFGSMRAKKQAAKRKRRLGI